MATAFVYVGTTGAHTPLVFNVTAEEAGTDLSAVTGATIECRKPDKTEVSWTAASVAYDVDTETLRLTYPFVSGDVDQKGAYTAYAVLTVPTGTMTTHRRTFTGRAEFDPTP